ncbi:MAG: hypothetical protein QNJ41_24605 [Xenococcaceae cyanobacterium MO_188.B32]|nr:hypothetical protein [Xenococcaceae cyanobacterium MO_188.B32]
MAINLQPTTIVNNNRSFRSFEIDGLAHPVKPIPQIVPLSIYDLEQNKVKRFTLHDDINFDLGVTSFRADIKDDDGNILQDNAEQPRFRYIQAIVNVLEQERVIENLNFWFSSYPATISNHIIFDHTKTYEVKVNGNVNRLTFFCEPIYLLPGIEVLVPNREDTGAGDIRLAG